MALFMKFCTKRNSVIFLQLQEINFSEQKVLVSFLQQMKEGKTNVDIKKKIQWAIVNNSDSLFDIAQFDSSNFLWKLTQYYCKSFWICEIIAKKILNNFPYWNFCSKCISIC